MEKVQLENNSSGLSEIDPSDFLIPTKDLVQMSPSAFNCIQITNQQFEVILSTDYYLNGVIGLGICFLGVILNFFCLLVLSSKAMRKTLFNQLLIFTLLMSMTTLILRAVYTFQEILALQVYAHVTVYPVFVHTLLPMSRVATAYMVVAILHERWSVVCCSQSYLSKTSNLVKLMTYIGLVLLLSLVLNLPKFFEIEWAEYKGMYFYRSTSLRTNPYYSIYYICWTSLLFVKLIPTFLIIFYSIKTYSVLKDTPDKSINRTSSLAREKRLARVFIVVAIAYFVTNLPSTMINIHEAVNVKRLVYCRELHLNGVDLWNFFGNQVNNFLMVVFQSFYLLLIFLPVAGYRKQLFRFVKCYALSGSNDPLSSGDFDVHVEMTEIDATIHDQRTSSAASQELKL